MRISKWKGSNEMILHTCDTGVFSLFGKENPTSGVWYWDGNEEGPPNCVVVLLGAFFSIITFPLIISFASQSVGLWSKWFSSSLENTFLLRPTAGLPDRLLRPSLGLINIFISIITTNLQAPVEATKMCFSHIMIY